MEIEEFLNVIRKRRSTIGFKPDPIPDEHLMNILEAARWAPSAANSQPWETIVVKDPAIKRQIEALFYHFDKGTQMNRSYITQAPILIVVCADPRTKRLYPPRHGDESREKIFVSGIAASIQNMLLAATAQGLGSLWLTVQSEPEVQKEFKGILGVPEEIRMMFMVPIGFPTVEKPFRGRRVVADFLHRESFDRSRLKRFDE